MAEWSMAHAWNAICGEPAPSDIETSGCTVASTVFAREMLLDVTP
jgi:hypothetical protein